MTVVFIGVVGRADDGEIARGVCRDALSLALADAVMASARERFIATLDALEEF